MSVSKGLGGSISGHVSGAISYHIQTKHHFRRYARSLGYLDWKNQPNPFRRYQGAELLPLTLIDENIWPYPSPSYYDLFRSQNLSIPVNRVSLSRFLELSLGLTAWKQAGQSTWALRSNPSSGNLHPTEGYVILPATSGFSSGLYHYCPKEQSLERRADFDSLKLESILSDFPPDSFLVGLSSIHWREAWKYGERAYRYCNHDIGHAIASLKIGASTLGWNAVLLDGLSQDDLSSLLGTSRSYDFPEQEKEHSDTLLLVWPRQQSMNFSFPMSISTQKITQLLSDGACRWYGQANQLSGEQEVHWDIIDHVAANNWKRSEQNDTLHISTGPVEMIENRSFPDEPPAVNIIRQRRSGVSFDPTSSMITFDSFIQLLSRVFPFKTHTSSLQSEDQICQPDNLGKAPPWDVWTYEPTIHLLLFVHRVTGLDPGIYLLLRDPDLNALRKIQSECDKSFDWEHVPNQFSLPLYLLREGDVTTLAQRLSCNQEIAGESAFSLGMIAEFEGPIQDRGDWWYPRIFWESGIIGHLLYLESEVIGMRSTGIGCYFDDPVHELLGLAPKSTSYQSIYHFTIGAPVVDSRISTLPPYYHLIKNGKRILLDLVSLPLFDGEEEERREPFGMSVQEIESREQFESYIAIRGKLIVIDFYATWCGPCQYIKPHYQKLAQETENVLFLSVDVDSFDEITSECGVSAMPTFLFYKDGQQIAEVRGADPEELKATIRQYK